MLNQQHVIKACFKVKAEFHPFLPLNTNKYYVQTLVALFPENEASFGLGIGGCVVAVADFDDLKKKKYYTLVWNRTTTLLSSVPQLFSIQTPLYHLAV
jgi:hypothetical protein